MAADSESKELTDEQVEGVVGGYINPSAWAKISDMAREKKAQGMSLQQFQAYLWDWRAKTHMEGYTIGNLDRDFDSILDYCCEEWEHF